MQSYTKLLTKTFLNAFLLKLFTYKYIHEISFDSLRSTLLRHFSKPSP